MKSRGLCALGCSAFRDSDRFTVTRSVQKGRGISLSWRDLRVISPSYHFATDTSISTVKQGCADLSVDEIGGRSGVCFFFFYPSDKITIYLFIFFFFNVWYTS